MSRIPNYYLHFFKPSPSLSGGFLKTPSITFNRVVMDFELNTGGTGVEFFDARTGGHHWVRNSTTKVVTVNGSTEKILVNGVTATGAFTIQDNTRTVLDVTYINSVTDDVNVFSYNQGGSYTHDGKLYNLKFYNGESLVAHYNPTLNATQDHSGNGHHATLYNTVWVIREDKPLSYLSLDGVDDYIKTPNITFTKIEIDFYSRHRPNNPWNAIISTSSSISGNHVFQAFGDSANSKGYTTPVFLVKSMGNRYQNLPSTIHGRYEIQLDATTPITGEQYLFSLAGTGDFYNADVYSIKFYNNETLVAHYDMSTGTVNDVSGNGNHATLIGGTWVQEEGGGTETDPISHTLSLSDSIATNDAITKRFSIITNDSILTTEHIMKQLQRNISDSIDLNDSFSNFGGKSVLLTDSINITDSISIAKRLSRFLSESVSLSDELNKSSSQSIVIYDAIITNDNIDLFNPNAPSLIGVIHLKGKRDLFVYLQGKRELAIFLKGGLNMVSNQNFNMVSGDTKTILINIEEDLLGADVRWALFKRGESVETLIKSGNIIDGQINITLNKDDTEGLKGIYSHECEVTDQNGNVSTVTTGIVTIINDMI